MKCIDAISTAFKRSTSNESVLWSGKFIHDIPCFPIKPLLPVVIGACTGPLGGLCRIQLHDDEPSQQDIIDSSLVAGISNWDNPPDEADGISLSLYDRKDGTVGRHGDPIADVYAVVVRQNNTILAVADGCSWGHKPRLAARCAVRGSMEYLTQKLFNGESMVCDTQQIIRNMLRSFDSAQKMIVENNGTTTTLCVAVVCELAEPKGENGWGLCVVSVGDSPCFVWQSKARQVIEVTSAAHEGQNRDMRDSGGCLGANVGDDPDLDNLTCSFALLAKGDIVFVTSDGISDNFDPVTLLEPTTPAHSASPHVSLPVLSPDQRQAALLANLTRVIQGIRSQFENEPICAWEVKEAIVKHVIDVTNNQRGCMETSLKNVDNPELSTLERRAKELEFKEKLKTMGGKLDHATLAVYEVCCCHNNRRAR
eukprot:Em0011g306a